MHCQIRRRRRVADTSDSPLLPNKHVQKKKKPKKKGSPVELKTNKQQKEEGNNYSCDEQSC